MSRAVYRLFIAVLLFSFAPMAFAQNGVPLGALRDNPYFSNGSDFSDLPPEEQDEYEKENQVQYDDPNNANFYNAENWTGGGMTSDSGSQFEEYEGSADLEGQSGEDATVPSAEDGSVMFTDSEIKELLLGSSYYKSHFNITLGYMPTFVVPVGEKGFASYFSMKKQLFMFPVGASFTAEGAFGSDNLRFGPGLTFDWTLLYSKLSHYTIVAHELDGGLYFFIQWPVDESAIVSVKAGASCLALLNLTQEYTNGLRNEGGDFFYPELMAGTSLRYYLFSFFGVGMGLDFRWPFLMDEPVMMSLYPRVQISIFTAWRF